MRKAGFILCLSLVPTLLLSAGCGAPYRQQFGPGDIDGVAPVGIPTVRVTEELESDGWATLEGRITFDGELPKGSPINITRDEAICGASEAIKRGDHLDQTWMGKNGGVANVVIFLKPPDRKHFKIYDKYQDASEEERLKKVILDQPFCAYDPRIVVLFPGYSDGKTLISSGQVFEVKNSAATIHNVKITANPAVQSSYDSGNMPPGGRDTPNMKPQDTPMPLSCDVHPWMKGYAWAFNHPYAVRTDLEGNFKIPNVPAGAEVSVVIWHEGIGFYKGNGFDGKNGKAMTFTKDQPTKLELSIQR